MERLLDEVSFDAAKLDGQSVRIDAAYVDARLAALSHNEDLSRLHSLSRLRSGARFTHHIRCAC